MKKSPFFDLGYLLLFFFLLLGFLLRVVYLTKIPPGFNWDEASVGYNAYSLLKTGRDEFGKPWPIYMQAFGEYKIGLYSMLLAPFIRLFGLSVFTVRFPNVIFGCLIILASFYLSLKIFKKTLPSSLAAGLVAISPWAIHTSRFTLEWYFGVPLFIFGLVFLLKALGKPSFYLISALLFSISLYSYHNLRFFLPLLLLGFVFIYKKGLKKQTKWIAVSLLVGLLSLLPLFLSMKSTDFLARAKDVAIFKNEDLNSELMEGMFRHIKAKLPFVRLFNNKPLFYGKEFADRYLAHFSPQFLFSGFDVTPRIGIKKVGKLYYASIPFLIFGLIELLTKNKRIYKFLFLWVLLAPISSSMTIDTPHALRSFLLVPVLQIIIVLGIVRAYQAFQKSKPLLLIPFFCLTLFLYLGGFIYFLWQYFLFYPEDSASFWQIGHKEMVEKLNQRKDRFDKVVITTHYGQPHIFVAFFTPIDPGFYQTEVNKENQREIFYERVPYLGNIQFRQITDGDLCIPNSLIITEKIDRFSNLPLLDVVYTPNRFHKPEPIFNFYDTNEPQIHDAFCQ